MMEILLPPTSDITLEELETWCSAQGYLILCEGSDEEFNKATTLIDKVTELQAKLDKAVEALEKSRDTFKRYSDLHSAKKTRKADQKAAVNWALSTLALLTAKPERDE